MQLAELYSAFDPLKWSDIQPSMVTYTQNSCSAFTHPSAQTQQWTQTPWTHTRSNGQPFKLRCPGRSWGFGVLLKGTSVVVLRVERERCTFTPPTNNSCWNESFDYESNSLTIRPRLRTSIIGNRIFISIFIYLFSHLADAFIQSNLQMKYG